MNILGEDNPAFETVSLCDRCGTPFIPGSPFCNQCGHPLTIGPAVAFVPPPPGTQRALIGSTPIYQAFTGFLFIIMGLVALSITPFFAPIGTIIILIGAVLLILGLLGKPIFSQQIVYQTAPTPTVYSAGAMKQCPRCGTQLMSPALVCYKCGASQ
jgi:hypothetical protein